MSHLDQLKLDLAAKQSTSSQAQLQLDHVYVTTEHGILFSDDCLHTLRSMRADVIDCIFADPPFNIGKDYKNGYQDRLDERAYYDWCREWIKESCRVLKPGGAIFLYATPEIAIHFGGILNSISSMQFRHWIALTMKGTYPRGKKLYPAHYALLYYTKGDPQRFNKIRVPVPTCRHCGEELKDYGGHRDKLHPDGLNLTDFWEDTSPNRHSKYKVRVGVNELKLMIPERAILISTNEGDIVLDPFAGGGSTLQAAELHKRNWIGIELYDCEHITTRLSERFPGSVHLSPQFDYQSLFQSTEEHGVE